MSKIETRKGDPLHFLSVGSVRNTIKILRGLDEDAEGRGYGPKDYLRDLYCDARMSLQQILEAHGEAIE